MNISESLVSMLIALVEAVDGRSCRIAQFCLVQFYGAMQVHAYISGSLVSVSIALDDSALHSLFGLLKFSPSVHSERSHTMGA